MRAYRAFDSGARCGDHAEDRGLPLYGHFHRYGCFRYPNASANTYRIAADLLEYGANAAEINRLMFDTKSRAAVALLKRLYGNMEFHCDGKGSGVLPDE